MAFVVEQGVISPLGGSDKSQIDTTGLELQVRAGTKVRFCF